MGTKKKIKKLLGALEGAFKGTKYRKNLKQTKVFEDLVERLEKRRSVLEDKLKDKTLSTKKRKALKRKLTVLDEEIPRAAQILKGLRRGG